MVVTDLRIQGVFSGNRSRRYSIPLLVPPAGKYSLVHYQLIKPPGADICNDRQNTWPLQRRLNRCYMDNEMVLIGTHFPR